MTEVIQIDTLPIAANVCQQELREVWQDSEGRASIAHVIMQSGAVSLLHRHARMTEVYHILNGTGELTVGDQVLTVRRGSVVEVPVGAAHKLENTGRRSLTHLVTAIPAFDPTDVEVLE